MTYYYDRFSVLPAISLYDGILHTSIIEGSFRTDSFLTFVEDLLERMQPFLAQNSVLVMDNCKIHKHTEILEAITARCVLKTCSHFQKLMQSRGMLVEFLPPYSPDFNPIELAFSAMKYHLQCNGDYVRFAMTEMDNDAIYQVLEEALYEISPQDCYKWYKHCGYV
jgi:transposase